MDLGEFYGNIRLIFSGSLKYSTFDKGRREAAIEWKLFGIFIKYPHQCTFQNNLALATNSFHNIHIHIKCHQPTNLFLILDGRPSPNCCACWNMSVFTFKLLMLLNSIELSQTSIRSEWLLRNCQINFVEIFSSSFIKKISLGFIKHSSSLSSPPAFHPPAKKLSPSAFLFHFLTDLSQDKPMLTYLCQIGTKQKSLERLLNICWLRIENQSNY